MTKRTLTLMAMALVAATAITTATAFAGTAEICRQQQFRSHLCLPPVGSLVAAGVTRTANATTLLKLRRPYQPRPPKVPPIIGSIPGPITK